MESTEQMNKYILLLMLFACNTMALPPLTFDDYEWPAEYYDSVFDKIHTEVNNEFEGTVDTCLPAAIEKTKRFSELGYKGQIVAVFPYNTTKNHAVFVYDSIVYDNCALGNEYAFPKTKVGIKSINITTCSPFPLVELERQGEYKVIGRWG